MCGLLRYNMCDCICEVIGCVDVWDKVAESF